jgi:DNA-directed RNA polymerase subunit K/omega
VLIASQEARFINDQIRLDIAKQTDKPTTMALKRLFEGRVVVNEEDGSKG